MTAVERAKRFLKQKSRTIALTAIPLAALTAVSTPHAKAGALTLLPTNCTETVFGGTLSSGSCQTSALAPSNGATGVKLFGTGTGNAVNSGSGLLQLEFFASGSASGAFNGTIPVSWNFSLTDNNGGNVDWSISLSIFGTGGSGSFLLSSSTPGQSPVVDSGTVSGSGFANVNIANATGYSLSVTASVSGAANNDSVTMNVPQNSIDINSVKGLAGVPEPSTWATMASGLTGLLWWRKRRKRS